MKRKPHFSFALIAASIFVVCGLASSPANAGFIVTVDQVGSNVVATGIGAIDLTGLTMINGVSSSQAQMQPNTAAIIMGPTALTTVDVYAFGFSGPTSFGSGGVAFASSGSGDLVGIIGASREVGVPHLYVSGNALSDTSTYNNATFGSLGVTPGVYEWTWGTGPNQNFTLDVVAPTGSVPDSGATWLLLLLGLTAAFGLKSLPRRLA